MFVVLVVVAFVPLGGKTPGLKKTPAEIADFYSKHHSKESAAAFVLAIGAALPGRVRRLGLAADPRRGPGVVGRCSSAAGWSPSAGFLVGAAIHLALADGAKHGLDPVALQALNALDNDDFLRLRDRRSAIMLLGAAGAMIPRARGAEVVRLDRLSCSASPRSLRPASSASLGAGLWIIAASIVLFMRGGKAASDAPTPAAA